MARFPCSRPGGVPGLYFKTVKQMKTADGISRGQAHEAMNQVEHTMKLMGVPDIQEAMSEAIKEQVFRKAIKSHLKLRGFRMKDSRFAEPYRIFQLQVPTDYDHSTQLTRFNEELQKKRSSYVSPEMTEEKFGRTTHPLRRGRKYEVSIRRIIHSSVTGEDILEFMDDHNFLGVGAKGLSLAYQLRPEDFPEECEIVTFDAKPALFTDEKKTVWVPCIATRLRREKGTAFIPEPFDNVTKENRAFLICFSWVE